jgi:nucleotide-binding universal stress UspA family protein
VFQIDAIVKEIQPKLLELKGRQRFQVTERRQKDLRWNFILPVKNKIDLIVIGSHGVSGLEEILVGSNTEK